MLVAFCPQWQQIKENKQKTAKKKKKIDEK